MTFAGGWACVHTRDPDRTVRVLAASDVAWAAFAWLVLALPPYRLPVRAGRVSAGSANARW